MGIVYKVSNKQRDDMYKTIEEKTKAFRHFTVNTDVELETLVNNLKKYESLRFRGVCEAKYTMMTSLQRNCPPQKGRQKDYMSRLLHNVKNDAEVKTFFQSSGIEINDISCLALMQHLGLPTPLLDFSTDVDIALAFAADGLNMSSGSDETDGYVSLYLFDKVYEYEVGTPVQQVYLNGMVTGIQLWQDHLRQHPASQVDASILYNINEFVKWDDVKAFELTFIEHQTIAPGVVTLAGQSLNLSNPNLNRQKGCFIVNLYDEEMPLEDNWNMRTTEQRNQFWMSRASNFQTLPFSGVATREKMICYDIRKDVIDNWAKKHPVQLYDKSVSGLAQKLSDIKKLLDDKIQNDNL